MMSYAVIEDTTCLKNLLQNHKAIKVNTNEEKMITFLSVNLLKRQ